MLYLQPRNESRLKRTESDNRRQSIIAFSAGKSDACSDSIWHANTTEQAVFLEKGRYLCTIFEYYRYPH